MAREQVRRRISGNYSFQPFANKAKVNVAGTWRFSLATGRERNATLRLLPLLTVAADTVSS